MNDRLLDRAIDDALRELTAGEPHIDLRSRVLMRLKKRPPAPWRSPWVLMPTGVAAGIVLVALVARGLRPGGGVLDTTMAQPTGSASMPRPVVGPYEPAVATSQPTGSPEAIRSVRRRVRSELPSTPSISEVGVLAPPPLEVPSMELNEIDPAQSIRLTQLDAITPLTIEPIDEWESE
jgi:hypothetical protein